MLLAISKPLCRVVKASSDAVWTTDHTEGGDALNIREAHRQGSRSSGQAQALTLCSKTRHIDKIKEGHGQRCAGKGSWGLWPKLPDGGQVGSSAPLFTQPRLLQRGAGDSQVIAGRCDQSQLPATAFFRLPRKVGPNQAGYSFGGRRASI